MNNNSVCYVEKIVSINPIPNADNIELVIVGGWNAITKKGVYSVGDLVIIATTDAVIPSELSEKLEVTNYLRKGNRVRTVKLRGVYSECLIIPTNTVSILLTKGDDLMDILNIYKYEPPVKNIKLSSGKVIKYKENPNFSKYYKFPNYKNVPDMFTEEDQVEITRKIHGTNARFGIVLKTKVSLLDKVKRFFKLPYDKYEYIVGSHNVEKGSDSQGYYDTNVWKEISDTHDIKSKLEAYIKHMDIGSGIIVYGEIYGQGIQTNYDYELEDHNLACFDVTIDGKYCYCDLANYIVNCLDLEYVPVLYTGTWSKEIQDKYVFNNYINDGKVPHEGIVVKDITGERSKIAKVINPDYLIYSEKNNVGDSH
jgi:RNA ligase (TIGR02306 family)